MSTIEKRGNIFILTITGDDDHRLNPTLLDSLRQNLYKIRTQSTNSSVLITTSQGKFFSNGFDLNWAASNLDRLRLMNSKLRALVRDILHLPMPTIAAITGHASAGGFALGLSHDYIVMRKDRGYLYMSELDIGMVIPGWFMSAIRSKSGSPKVWREVVLMAGKLTAERGVELGIVDEVCDGAAETVEAAVRLGEGLMRRKWDGQVYADNRRVVYAELVRELVIDEEVVDGNEGKNDVKVFSKL